MDIVGNIGQTVFPLIVRAVQLERRRHHQTRHGLRQRKRLAMVHPLMFSVYEQN